MSAHGDTKAKHLLADQPKQSPHSNEIELHKSSSHHHDSSIHSHEEDEEDIKLKKFRSLQKFRISLINDDLGEFSVNLMLYFDYISLVYLTLWIVFFLWHIVGRFSFAPDLTTVEGNLQLFVAASVIIRLYRTLMEYLIGRGFDYEKYPWTEDLFSLLVENIPLDRPLDKLKEQFNNAISEFNIGSIVQVIKLQDYHEYMALKEKMRKTQTELDKNHVGKTKRKLLIKEKAHLEHELHEIEEALHKSELYQGKAIFIFSTMEAKRVIRKIFGRSWWQLHKFFTKSMTMRELTEPEDVLYENLHYPRFRAFMRRMFCYYGGILLALPVIYNLVKLEYDEKVEDANGEHEEETAHEEEDANPDDTSSFAGLIENFVPSLINFLFIKYLDYFMEVLFEKSHSLIKHVSDFEKKMSHQYFIITTKVLLFVGLQAVTALFVNPEEWVNQLVNVSIMLVLEVMLKKAYRTFFSSEPEFELIEEFADVIPLVLFFFTFAFVEPFTLLLTLLFGLFSISCLDRFRLVKYCEPAASTAPRPILRLYKSLSLEYICIVVGAIIRMQNIIDIDTLTLDAWPSNTFYKTQFPAVYQRYLNDYETELANDSAGFINYLMIEAVILVVLIILPAIFCNQTLSARIRHKFLDNNRKTTYESVSKEFSVTYKETDPFCQLQAKKNQNSVNIL